MKRISKPWRILSNVTPFHIYHKNSMHMKIHDILNIFLTTIVCRQTTKKIMNHVLLSQALCKNRIKGIVLKNKPIVYPLSSRTINSVFFFLYKIECSSNVTRNVNKWIPFCCLNFMNYFNCLYYWIKNAYQIHIAWKCDRIQFYDS